MMAGEIERTPAYQLEVANAAQISKYLFRREGP
jgi:hypothetical protein